MKYIILLFMIPFGMYAQDSTSTLKYFEVDDSFGGIHNIVWEAFDEDNLDCYTLEASYALSFSPAEGKSYYRLHMKDLDGSYSHSEVLIGNNSYDLLRNPFVIKDARVTDASGREVNLFHRGIFFVSYKGSTFKIVRL